MPKIEKTQVINETRDWVCFTPDPELVKGHICFKTKNKLDDNSFTKMYNWATRYGNQMKEIGFYSNYKIYFLTSILHLVPDSELPEDWLKQLTNIDKSVIV